MHDNVHNCSMERAVKSTIVVGKKNAAMETARAAKTGIDKVNEELEYLQKMMKHLNIRFFPGLFVSQAKTPRVLAF